jgi:hypothetical protein
MKGKIIYSRRKGEGGFRDDGAQEGETLDTISLAI